MRWGLRNDKGNILATFSSPIGVRDLEEAELIAIKFIKTERKNKVNLLIESNSLMLSNGASILDSDHGDIGNCLT